MVLGGAEAKVRGEKEDQSVVALVLDLAAEGVRPAVHHPPRVGDRVDLTLRLPGGSESHLPAEVVRVEPLPGGREMWQVGCRFVGTNPTSRAWIESFVANGGSA